MIAQVLVLAKSPQPGRVKTRLCPPCTPQQAADVALAALHDTLDTVDEMPASLVARRTLVLDGDPGAPASSSWWPRRGWRLHWQRDGSLGERIGHAFTDTAVAGLPSVLIGMDTPQITGTLLSRCVGRLAGADAVLGPAVDGGWWLLALRDPSVAPILAAVPTSRPDTGARTRELLGQVGLSVALAPVLRDVDTAADAWRVAERCRAGRRFPAAVRAHVPSTAAERPTDRSAGAPR